jgi:ABC-type polysaccharide/polyol phosphate export permease
MSNPVQYAHHNPPSAEDAANLRLLAICQIAFGGLGLLIGALLTMTITADPQFQRLVLAFLIADLFCVLSGICMFITRFRIFSMFVAAITCVVFPIGPIMGVWALIVLCRPGVAQLYKSAKG